MQNSNINLMTRSDTLICDSEQMAGLSVIAVQAVTLHVKQVGSGNIITGL